MHAGHEESSAEAIEAMTRNRISGSTKDLTAPADMYGIAFSRFINFQYARVMGAARDSLGKKTVLRQDAPELRLAGMRNVLIHE